ncbi:MAG: reverse transcriptase/maturase family protein [Tannerellaceae bacterium]|nr:reverse transcriptase/maturase family protein [Tannerellaceae bacterium]
MEKRQLGLLTVRDKIVQQAIKSVIEPKLDKLFLGNSYGYRLGKGPLKAIYRVEHVFKQFRKGWVAKLDIDDFFDTICHDSLFNRLDEQLKDLELLRLIELCVKAGVVTPHMKWNDMTRGVPQGAVLFPLLANFYLHPLDKFILTQTSGYIRYADNFLIVTQSEESLIYTIYKIRNELEKKFRLKLNEPVISTLEKGIEFLGIMISKKGLSLSTEKNKDLRKRIHSISFQDHWLTPASKETLQGIKSYYGRLLLEPALKELDVQLMKRVRFLIQEHRQQIPNKTRLMQDLKELNFFSEEMSLSKPILIRDLTDLYLLKTTVKKYRKKKILKS